MIHQKRSCRIVTLLLSLILLAYRGIAQDNLNLNAIMGEVDSSGIFSSPEYYTWCTSVIKGEDGRFHMFYARWPHGKRPLSDDSMNHIFNGFRGWLKYSEIAYAVADHLNGPYHYVKTILKGDGSPSRWDRYTMHNVQIRKFGNAYYLYYISNSFDPQYKAADTTIKKDWLHWLRYNCTQSIGVLKAASIKDLVNGRFQRSAQPIMKVDNLHTFEVTTNPTVTEGPDGKYYMMYKSRKPGVGNMTLWMARADKPDQRFTFLGEVFTSSDMACEDPCMWYDQKRKRFYAAVKYYSHSKKMVPQFGALALITSDDGRSWYPAAHPLVSLREITIRGKGKVSLAHLERPFVITDAYGQPLAMFAAASLNEPSGITDPSSVPEAFNTFSVCIPFKKQQP